jgi:RHS repeat-associated protein
MDDLTYSYNPNSPNQLMKVAESTSGNTAQGFIDGTNTNDDYAYDANGNMTKDGNKSIINIKYNHLNLPLLISGSRTSISYLYNAIGQKVCKTVSPYMSTPTFTDYFDGFQYSTPPVYGVRLEFFPTAEGYVKNTPATTGGANVYSYVYNYTDHLGNVRLSYSAPPSGVGGLIIEENNYYPFGMKHAGYNDGTASNPNKYKYNGKELQDELGLNFYDYDNRVYDPATGRFLEMDPLGELGRRWSSYNYCFDNPMYFRDPDGMWPDPPNFKNLWNQIKRDLKDDFNQVKREIGNSVQKIDAFLTGKGDKNDTSGGYDFRSDLKKNDDSSGKVQKRTGSDTQIVDVTGLDAAASLGNQSKGMKDKASVASLAKNLKEGLSLGSKVDKGVSMAKETIEEGNKEQTKSKAQNSENEYYIKPDPKTSGNNIWLNKSNFNKDGSLKKTE